MTFALSACAEANTNAQCAFTKGDEVVATITDEAQETFELAKAYDGQIYRVNVMTPEPAPPVLEQYAHIEEDRVKARALYLDAANLGHLDAMYRYASFAAEGLGRADGRYDPEFDEAFYWFEKVARRGDPYGFNAMANFYLYGLDRKVDVPKGEACLVQAAMRGMMIAQVRLGRLDLGVLEGFGGAPKNPEYKIERGLVLLEDAAFKGEVEVFSPLHIYYRFTDRPMEAEFYARLGVIRENRFSRTNLESGYLSGSLTPENAHLAPCVDALKPEDFSNLEELCPRVGGPLTR